MTTRRIASTEPREPKALVYRAALAPAGSGRKAWTQDSEGEGILSICIPASDADDLGGNLHWLRSGHDGYGRTFRVAIILDDDATTLDLPAED